MPARFHLPLPIQREVAAVWKVRIYVAGGLDGAGSSVGDVLSIDPTTGRVVQLGRMPRAFHDGAAAIIGHTLFTFGGGEVSGSDVIQAFNLARHRSRVAGRLPVALSDLAAASVNGTVYLVGGFDNVTPQTAIYATTDGRRFDVVGHLPVGLRYPAVAARGSALIVAGGDSDSGPVSTVYRFVPRTGHVSVLGHLPAPVGHATAVALGSRVYVLGGRGAAGDALRSAFVIVT